MRLWQWMTWEAAEIGRSMRRALTTAGSERDLTTQSLKAAGAAVLAWAVTGWWWGAPMALMAPWAAVVLVQSTVYRSVRSGLQQMAVIAVGTALATGAAVLTGNTLAAMAVALPLTALLGNYRRFGEQGMYASTTALFVLAYGTYSGFDILHRLLESLIGGLIGITVNALILPPVHLRSVRDSLDRLPGESADLLRTMAEEIGSGYDRRQAEAWHQRAHRLGAVLADLRHARQQTTESYRFNPGRRLRRSGPPLPSADWDHGWERIVEHLAALTRILADAAGERRRLAPPPDSVLAEVPELLLAAADVCVAYRDPAGAGGDGGGEERARAVSRAWDVHARIKGRLAEQDPETATSLGGLVAEGQQLLYELAVE
ncbi:aromatic acid exporter family protein [Streptomyces sp. NPDC051219]|uniref:FUSC family protein n=1 Tax=Streptomyces sp. NPDC051219 TaxID=3155283 RepID=UPI0034258377